MWRHALVTPHFAILVVAWLAAILMMPLLIRLAHRIGAVDRPRDYKAHGGPVPFLGGIAVYAAFSLGILVSTRDWDLRAYDSFLQFALEGSPLKPLFGIVIGGAFVLLLGLLDDFRPINAMLKLMVLFLIALLLHHFEIRVRLFPDRLEWLNIAVSLLWLAGVTSAMNSLDHMDGNCSGAAAICAIFTFLFSWDRQNPQPWLSYAALALLGATLGFLQFNFKPARIFLGNSGAFLVGFLLAAMTILGAWGSREEPIKALLIPPLLLGVPLYDITLATLLRWKSGTVKNIYEAVVFCGRDHLSHRLVALGLSERAAVVAQYALGCLFGTVALTSRYSLQVFLFGVACLLVFLVALGMVLDRAPMPREGTK